jgi:hypothetical protein
MLLGNLIFKIAGRAGSLVLLCFLMIPLSGFTQRKPIQFSGVIVTGDSLKPVPFATIMVKNTTHGTVADYYGFFSFVAQEGDVITFDAIGHQESTFTIPDTLDENRYSIIQMMFTDTIRLRETVIYSWPTREQFKQAFLNLDVPDDDLIRAQRNLELEKVQRQYASVTSDAGNNYNYTMRQQSTKLYYAGQAPPLTLMNPVAWSKFIRAWKNGDFKKKY